MKRWSPKDTFLSPLHHEYLIPSIENASLLMTAALMRPDIKDYFENQETIYGFHPKLINERLVWDLELSVLEQDNSFSTNYSFTTPNVINSMLVRNKSVQLGLPAVTDEKVYINDRQLKLTLLLMDPEIQRLLPRTRVTFKAGDEDFSFEFDSKFIYRVCSTDEEKDFEILPSPETMTPLELIEYKLLVEEDPHRFEYVWRGPHPSDNASTENALRIKMEPFDNIYRNRLAHLGIIPKNNQNE